MSGPTSTDRPQDSTQHTSSTDSSAMDVDPAASLRALALSTLKKRKVPGPKAAESLPKLPSRPVILDNSIQLNYGPEEPELGASSIASSDEGRPTSRSAPPTQIAMDVDNEQVREEGEISDSEDGAAATPSSTPKTVPARPQPSVLNLPMKPTVSPMATPVLLSSAKDRGYTSPEIPSKHSSQASVSSQRPLTSAHEVSSLDDFQIRPGLTMTEAQYNSAKDIILDLLGWGVPPEYLVDCGLSREIIYFVFLELNLRLPSNLDLSGLPPPYGRPLVRYASPEPMSPPVATLTRQRSQSATTRQTQGHPSLPRKPSAPQGAAVSEGTPLSATAAPFVPGTPGATEAPNTIDIELQRKQELLARKAVLASRKSKQAPSPPTKTTLEARLSEAGPSKAEPPVPKQTVDDFLNSIGPVSGSSPILLNNEDSEMDVDGPIPGLSSTLPTAADPAPPPHRASTTTGFASGYDANMTPQTLPLLDEQSRRSLSRSDEKSDFSEPHTREPSVGPKRGTKRPVASDFVDTDSNSSRSYYSTYREYQSNNGYPPRKRQSFAAITSSRRMVIHLSDTSDDDDDEAEEETLSRKAGQSHTSRPSLPSTRLSTTVSTPITGTTSPAITTATLQQEIEKMRELIALREQAQKEKQAARSKRHTPVTLGEGIKKDHVTVKQEDDDAAASASLARTTPSVEMNDEGNVNALTSAEVQPLSSVTPLSSTGCAPQPQQHRNTSHEVPTVEAQRGDVGTVPIPVAINEDSNTDRPRLDCSQVDAGYSLAENPSTQEVMVPHNEQNTRFVAYSSPLSSYPLLRANSPQSIGGSLDSTGPNILEKDTDTPTGDKLGSAASYILVGIDLEAIKAAAVNRWLSDPSRRLCQYEIPGGGQCRDRDCEDIHPSLVGDVEPSDEEIARHVYAALPKSSPVTLERLQTALQEAQRPGCGYHTRVQTALATLGLRLQT